MMGMMIDELHYCLRRWIRDSMHWVDCIIYGVACLVRYHTQILLHILQFESNETKVSVPAFLPRHLQCQ
jgi:hypothetical protein